jgi:hypothetical protein
MRNQLFTPGSGRRTPPPLMRNIGRERWLGANHPRPWHVTGFETVELWELAGEVDAHLWLDVQATAAVIAATTDDTKPILAGAARALPRAGRGFWVETADLNNLQLLNFPWGDKTCAPLRFGALLHADGPRMAEAYLAWRGIGEEFGRPCETEVRTAGLLFDFPIRRDRGDVDLREVWADPAGSLADWKGWVGRASGELGVELESGMAARISGLPPTFAAVLGLDHSGPARQLEDRLHAALQERLHRLAPLFPLAVLHLIDAGQLVVGADAVILPV